VAKEWVFDSPRTQAFTKARQDFLSAFLAELSKTVKLASAIDVGCALGDFSKFLSDRGMRVVGVDGRQENIDEAALRYPNISFRRSDAEDLPIADLGRFDFTLCLGLLYHLENPFRLIRGLSALTSEVAILEGVCTPDSVPSMELLDEGVEVDQGLNYVAFYPSEPCLVKMLYCAGFPFVYRFRNLPNDELYTASKWRKRPRTMLAASRHPLNMSNLVLATEPIRPVHGEIDSWATPLRKLWVRTARIKNLLARPTENPAVTANTKQGTER